MPIKHKGEKASRGKGGKVTDAISGTRQNRSPRRSDLAKLRKK